MNPVNVVICDTQKHSEKEINNWLDKLPPVRSVKTAGNFIIVECESLLNEKGSWKKHVEDIFQTAAK